MSSPVDVAVERQRVQRVIEHLNGEFAGVARFEAIRWETAFYSADTDFQSRIAKAHDCDVVIGIFWGRLGSRLPDSFERMPDALAREPGEPYPSGSGYEILSALHARAQRDEAGKRGFPDVYVFRKSVPPHVAIGEPSVIAEAQDQWQRLEAFFKRWFRNEQGQILRASHTFADIDGFERDVLTLLRDWTRSNVTGAASIIWPIATHDSPFPGLNAFEARHAPVFFGRDRKILRAIEIMKAASGWREPDVDVPPVADDAASPPAASPASDNGDGEARQAGADPRERKPRPFLLIVGPSGAGKSSFMRAGVLPRLAAPGVVTGVAEWRTGVLRPLDRETPFLALAAAVTGALGTAETAAVPATEELARLLAQEPSRAASLVVAQLEEAAQRQAASEGSQRLPLINLAIGVDQLDELFGPDIDPAQRAGFARAIAELTLTRRVWAVGTLRGDIYEDLIANRAWLALKDAGATYDLAPPGPEEFEEIVQKSAAASGLVYETDPRSGHRLDRRLLEEAAGENALPLLQFTLEKLFEARAERDGETVLTVAAYEALGGLGGAIEQSAEAAFKGLAGAEREALPRLLRKLAVPGVGRDTLTVRAVPMSEVAADGPLRRLVEALVAARVLSTSKQADGTSTLRFAHQRVLDSWQRANSIIEEHRDFYRIRDDVEQQYARWNARRRRQLLIPPGVAIAEAEKIARAYGDELTPDIRTFIRQSGSRARLRWSLMRTATMAFALLALAAGVLALLADRSYTLARGTIDRLLTSFGGSLTNVDGIKVATLERSYQEIGRAVDELSAQASMWDPTFDATRATMLYEFGRTYRKANPRKAMAFAEQSLELRQRMQRLLPGSLDAQWRVAQSHQLVGDLIRDRDPEAAERHFLQAAQTNRMLYARQQDQKDWAGSLMEINTRLGDIEADKGRALLRAGKRQEADARFAGAARYYKEQLDVALASLMIDETEIKWHGEVSWGLNKVVDDLLRGANRERAARAVELADLAVCLRRSKLAADTLDTRAHNDVAWSLQRRGQALERLGLLGDAEAAFLEAFVIRREILDPKDNTLVNDLAVIEGLVGKLYLRLSEPQMALAFLAIANSRITQLANAKILRDDARRLDIPAALAAAEKATGETGFSTRHEELVLDVFQERQRGFDRLSTVCMSDALKKLRSFAVTRTAQSAP